MPKQIDSAGIERRLLDLAYTTDAKITATALAYFAPCSIDDAQRLLDDLAARDRLSMEIEDDGTVAYVMLGRQKFGPEPSALAPIAKPHRHASPLLAAVLTLFMPGAGHVYAGRVVAGLLWFVIVSMAYGLILPGLVLHLISISSAAASAHRLNAGNPRLLAPGHMLLSA